MSVQMFKYTPEDVSSYLWIDLEAGGELFEGPISR